MVFIFDFVSLVRNEGVVVLKEQNLLIFFKDLACKFCIFHGSKEPTTLTGTEAEADSSQNPEEESTAGSPYARIPSQTRGGVTNYDDHHRSRGWLPTEPWVGVTSRQPQCWTPLSEQRSHQLCWPLQKHLILVISRSTCATYFLINIKFYHLYMHLLMQLQWLLALFSACTRWCIVPAPRHKAYSQAERPAPGMELT